MTTTMQIVSGIAAAALIFGTTTSSIARAHNLRSHHSTYVNQLSQRTLQRYRDDGYRARAQAPALRSSRFAEDPPGSTFQDQGFREYLGQ
jgi:hypothetical protein